MIEEYKDSSLGSIPETWKVVTVREITAEHKQGFYTKDGYTKEGIRLARITDLNNPTIDYSSMPLLNISDSDYQSYKIRNGDFLFARSGAIGRYGIVENDLVPAIFASYLIRFRFNDNIVNRFFGYFFESFLCENQLRGITQGNANVNINAENIKSLKFPLLPFEEQKKIADILSTVDAKIEVIDQQIKETEELKKGMMQRLLTKGIGHTEFKDSPLGKIPKSWDVKRIGEISKVVRGASPRPKGDPRYYGGNVPRLMGRDVSRDGKYVIPKIDFLTEEGAKLSRFMPKGTLVMICSGDVGVPSILNVDACVHDGFLAFPEIDDSCDRDYLYHIFDSLHTKFNSSATHGGIYTNLTTSIIKDFEIPLPTLNEQIEISQITNTIDEKLEILKQKKNNNIELKSGLMNQLLTGKIRVNNLVEV